MDGVEREYRSPVFDSRRWERFSPRADDIFVCTPPKCGTTWMQTIVVTLLHDGDPPGRVTEIAPWIDARFEPIDVVLARLDAQQHRRAIKTHTPADGIPWFPNASYIVVGRDGRDAFMSYVNHMRNMRPDLLASLARSARAEGIELSAAPPIDDVHDFYAYWLYERPMWFEHVASFWSHHRDPNVLLVHYDDLLGDLEAEMRRVATFLGVAVAETRWPVLVEQCTFASMKARSERISDYDAKFIGGGETFLYKGTNGRWRGVLTADELDAFAARCGELLPDDAIAWACRADDSAPTRNDHSGTQV